MIIKIRTNLYSCKDLVRKSNNKKNQYLYKNCISLRNDFIEFIINKNRSQNSVRSYVLEVSISCKNHHIS